MPPDTTTTRSTGPADLAGLTGLTGRTFRTEAPYDVSAERVVEFRRAIHDDEPGSATGEGTASFTFPMVVAFGLMTSLMTDPSVGIELSNVIHRDERIEQARPVRVGDRLVGSLSVDSVRSAAGVDMIATRTEITTVDGEPVCTASATLVHRAGD